MPAVLLALQATVVAYLVVCTLQWALAERSIQRKIAASFELLEGVVSRSVQECLGEAVLARPSQALEEVSSRWEQLSRLRVDAKRVVASDDRATSLLARPPALPPLAEILAATEEREKKPRAPRTNEKG